MRIERLGALGSAAAVLRAVAAAASRLGLPPPAALTGDWFGSRAVIAPTVTIAPDRPRRGVRGSPGAGGAGCRRRLDRLPVVPGRRRRRLAAHPRGRRRLDGLRAALRPRRPLVVRKPFRRTDAGLASGRRHRAGAAPRRGASTGPRPTATHTAPGCWPAWRPSPQARCTRPACARSSPEPVGGCARSTSSPTRSRAPHPPARRISRADWGAVASLSPELFLRRRGDAVTSSPIKGTLPPARRPGGAAGLGQGRRREHHDRRPGAQRPGPRRGDGIGHGARTSGGAARARRVASGVHGVRAGATADVPMRRGAGRDVPAGVGHRYTETPRPRTAFAVGADASRSLLRHSRFGVTRRGHRIERGDPHRRVRQRRATRCSASAAASPPTPTRTAEWDECLHKAAPTIGLGCLADSRAPPDANYSRERRTAS